jgi:hypothetical protein
MARWDPSVVVGGFGVGALLGGALILVFIAGGGHRRKAPAEEARRELARARALAQRLQGRAGAREDERDAGKDGSEAPALSDGDSDAGDARWLRSALHAFALVALLAAVCVAAAGGPGRAGELLARVFPTEAKAVREVLSRLLDARR